MFNSSAQFELQVLPNGRTPADEYLHQNAIWIEGRENSKYILKFTNKTSKRVEVILSVDGLDTIKGLPAGPQSEGFVVNAYRTLDVPGWLLNNSKAAEFYFAKAGKSYVSASGNNTANTGVIGAMVFTEQANYYQYPATFAASISQQSYNKSSASGGTVDSLGQVLPDLSATATKSATRGMSTSVSQDVGTGFGNATDFNTFQTTFTRASSTQPDAILAIYYNTAENLRRMGINVRRSAYDNSSANPFPTYIMGAKPPPGWTP